MHRCMVSTQAVLVVAIIDGYFDRDRGINETDDGGGNADEVGVSPVCRTCKPAEDVSMFNTACEQAKKRLGSECLEIILAIIMASFYPATSVTRPPPTTRTGSWAGQLFGSSVWGY